MASVIPIHPTNRRATNHRPLLSQDPTGTLAAAVGNTPILRVTAPFTDGELGFWAKLEGLNPGGIKDRPAMYMVERARARGDLRPGARIIESTSGTLGLGLALAAKVYGHPVTVVSDTGLEPIVARLLSAYGVRVEQVGKPHPEGGWQQARCDRVAQLLAEDPDAWHPDQYNNPDNVDAYRGLALELHAQLGRVDVLVCSVGTGGHSSGVSRALRALNPALELIGVDTVGSTIFGQPAASRLMRGLGSSILPGNVDYRAFTEVHWVSPSEAVWASRALARTNYAAGGWSVGAVALVAGWAARTYPPTTTVAAIFPDGPQRYFDTVFNDDYCREHDLGGDPPGEPLTIVDPTATVVNSWARCTRVVDPADVGS